MRYAVLVLPFLIACGSITGLERDRGAQESASLIRFVLDNESCRGMVSLDFSVDKQIVGGRSMAAGDSVEFKTSPGPHKVMVRGASDGFGAYGEWQSMQVHAPVRVVLTC